MIPDRAHSVLLP